MARGRKGNLASHKPRKWGAKPLARSVNSSRDGSLQNESTLSTLTSAEQGPIAAKCRRPELHLALSEDLAQNAAPWYRGDSVVENATQARSVLHAIADAERAMLWSMVRLALTGSVTEEELFQSECSPNDHQSFTLRPMARSTVPLQWIHIGPWAIPDILADTSCSRMGVGELLHHLNSVLGTTYTMGVSGLQNCLRHVLNTSHDFGQAYGTLRTWWFDYDFTKVLRLMDTRREADEHLSSSAIQGCCITDSHIPPRRVWDLFSNRVLPFYSMPPGLHPHDIPDILCTVSHSWVSEWERKDVWTQINGEQWPVPIPRAISLEQIRVELLNMEAEYVWLDVLCLRRCGGCDKDNEEARREEWTLDVPTIGYTFSSHERRCITYFNGLGLPLDTSPSLLASERHWFSRVWILQDPSLRRPEFFARLDRLVDVVYFRKWQADLIQALRKRCCTEELDRTAALAYHLECTTLLLYDETLSPEDAWITLLKHARSWSRPDIFFRYAADTPFAVWVSWQQLLAAGPTFQSAPVITSDEEDLSLVDAEEIYCHGPGQYYHRAHVIGPCYITHDPVNTAGRGGYSTFLLRFPGQHQAASPLPVIALHGVVLPDVCYTLVGMGHESWIVIEVVGRRSFGRERALEAVKWGSLHVEKSDGRALIARYEGKRKVRRLSDAAST